MELLVVLALIALATGAAALALRDSDADRIEREGIRLAAVLEAARAESRASAVPIRFRLGAATAEAAMGQRRADFRFEGLPPGSELPDRWLEPATVATLDAGPLVLGPEPLIGAQRITLALGDWRLSLATDGLGPFTAGVATRESAP